MHTTPFLSVVVVSRNDNHGHSLNYRTQEFIDLLALQSKRFKIKSELIIVEWNPPKSNAKLINQFNYPSNHYLAVRIIEVPEEIHRRYRYSEQQPLYQMIGKNVGIARSLGNYILATNIDILFSDQTFRFIKKNLKQNCIYTAIRYDIPSPLPKIEPLEKIKWSSKNFFRVHHNLGSITLTIDSFIFYRLFGKIYILYSLYLKNLFTAKNKIGKVPNNYSEEIFKYIKLLDSLPSKLIKRLSKIFILFCKKLKSDHLNKKVTFRSFIKITKINVTYLYKKFFNLTKKMRARLCVMGTLLTNNFLINLYFHWKCTFKKLYSFSRGAYKDIIKNFYLPHTNACGDFTLCSRKVWHTLRGYPEWDMQSWHLDSVFIYQAMNSGFIINTLKGKIFHIEHSPGSGYTPEHANLLFDRLRKSGIRFLSNEEFGEIIYQQSIAIKPIVYNNKNWGLTDLDLPETRVNLE